MTDRREEYGKLVRDIWVATVRELIPDPKPSWLEPWETLTDEFQREVDMRIGEQVAAAERERIFAQPVTEHAYQMSGGGFQVWNEEPYITQRWPTAEKIRLEQRNGGKVWARKIIVIEPWTEVPKPACAVPEDGEHEPG